MAAIEGPGDWSVFLDPAVFGDAATYTPAGGAPAVIHGIFTAPHAANGGGAVPELSGLAPVLAVAGSDLPAPPAVGDAVFLRGVAWVVADVHPDGTDPKGGLVRLILERA